MNNNEELRKKIEEIVSRWYKNPPYAFPSWITLGFVKGLTDAQTIEILDLFRQEQIKLIEEIKDKLEKAKQESGKRNYNEEYEDGIDDAIAMLEDLKKTL